MSRRFRGTRRQVAGIADDTTPAEEMALPSRDAAGRGKR